MSDLRVESLVEAIVHNPLNAHGVPDGDADGHGNSRSFSVYDHIRTPSERRSVRQLPGLLRGALRLAWRAGRVPVLLSAAVELMASVGVTVQLLVTRHVLAAVISAQGQRAGFQQLVPELIVLVGISTAVGFAIFIRGELSKYLGELVARQAARELLDVAGAVDLEAYETPAFHDRLERARMNAQIRPMSAMTGLLGTVGAAMSIVAIAAALLVIAPLAVPAAMLSVIPLWLSARRNSKDFYQFATEMTPTDRERNYAQNVLSNKDLAKEVRAFSLTGLFRHRFESLYRKRITALRALVGRSLRRSLIANLVSSSMVGATLGLVFWLLVDGRLSLAATGTAVLGLVYFGQRLSAMVTSAGTLYESALFIDDFTLFLDLRHDVESSRPKETMSRVLERISVENVTFTYPGAQNPALRGVSMEVTRGQVIALVGDNGSGKTTLAKLLSGLYRPDSGHILWDGTDITTRDPEDYRRSVAVVFQDFGQYWLSAYDNIGIGAVDRLGDRTGILQAAQATNADPFLRELPAGYGTILSRLSEGGRDLSIGQWQRVALARMFFRDAPLTILDEPTASLDALSESRLFQTIREICRGRTVLLISHRFSTVRGADRIYVLDHGRIVEDGTHDELMQLDGKYAAMFSVQASAYADPL